MGLGLGLTRGQSGAFNPASLFTGGRIGLLLDKLTPSNLFTATGLVSPVAQFGDVIASARDLSGGNRVVQQATVADRPLWGRAPENGVRNIAHGGANVVPSAPWVASVTAAGVTATKTATGVDANNVPWVEYTANGTGAGTGFLFLFLSQIPASAAVSGQQFTGSAIISLVSGSVTAGADRGARVKIFGSTSANVYVEESPSANVLSNLSTPTAVTYTLAGGTNANVRLSAEIVVRSGAVFTNAVFRFSALQLESGAVRTAYQANYARWNIDEAGFNSITGIYHADSTDVLTATMPAMGTNCTIVYNVDGTITTLTGQTIGAGAFNLPSGAGKTLYKGLWISGPLSTYEYQQVFNWAQTEPVWNDATIWTDAGSGV